LYFAIPLLRNEGDTLNAPVAYVSAKYTEQISSKLNGEERVAAWRKFWDKSMQEFEQSIISFSYLEQYGKNDDRRFLEEAATKCRLYSNRQPIFILKPIREPFEQRTGKKGQQLFLFFFIGLVVWFSMIQIPGLHEIKARRFTVRANSTLRQIQEAWCTIRPRPGFAATPVLISVNIALFLFMVFAGLGVMNFYGNDLVDWGAIYKPHLVKGQWWRLFTYQFLHGGLAHITMNMIGLCLAGIILEPFLEKWRFLFGYLTAGLAAGIVSLWWHKQPIVTVGASGAIFGLYGMLLAMVVFRVFDVSTNRLLIVLLICTSGFGLLMGWLTSGIDNSAHIGGLIAGFIIGVYYVKTRKAYVTEEKWEVKKKGVEDWI
jgi:membrane associated rhomboid family serine protease